MEDKRFDQLARILGGVGGRREALKALLGGSVAGALGAFGLSEAEAKKKKGKGKKGNEKGKDKKGRDNSKNQKTPNRGKDRNPHTRDQPCIPDGNPCVGQSGRTCCPGTICGYNPNNGADVRCCVEGATCSRTPPPCNSTTCSSGCCDGDSCTAYGQQKKDKCGTGGDECRACSGTDICSQSANACQPITTCNLGTCNASKPCTCPKIETCGLDGKCCRTEIGIYCKVGEEGSGCCAPNYVCAGADGCQCADGYFECGGKCIPKSDCCTDGEPGCKNGQVCTDGSCVCPAERPHRCDGTGPCVACCGTGQAQCAVGQHCDNGTCVPDEQCVAVDGACNACHSCCRGSRCSKPNAPCSGPENAGTCVACHEIGEDAGDKDFCCSGCLCPDGKCCDASHCSQCTPACTNGNTCQNGNCRCGTSNQQCTGNQTCCGNACRNLNNDESNCGTCGNVCPASAPVCTGGVCRQRVGCQNDAGCNQAQGQICCNNICIDGRSDANNCGACNRTCGVGQTCVNGTCSGSTCAVFCDPRQCLTCNATGNGCISLCTGGTFCNGNGSCVGGGGGGGGNFCAINQCSTAQCLTCNTLTGQCTSFCTAGLTCNGAGVCTGQAGQTCAQICTGPCLFCNTDGRCTSRCTSSQFCDASGACAALPSGPGCDQTACAAQNGVCTGNICFVSSTCPAGQSNYECCKESVRKGCRHIGGGQSNNHGNKGGGRCRRQGKRRCRSKFGTT